MNYILFDGPFRNALLPFTYTRPVADIRIGILTIREKWEIFLGLTTTTSDSVEPFLEFNEKHTILLALTSNKGAFDFQTNENTNALLFESVLDTSKTWKNSKQLMYVVGATKAAYFKKIRDIVPTSFLLVPGIGVQGGILEEVCKYGLNTEVGLLVNSSRGIIYASNDRDFAAQAANKAKALQQRMQEILSTI